MTTEQIEAQKDEEKKSFFSVIVHSFFIIPFLIAVFCVMLFAAINLLTQEKRTAKDYLNDVKIGGSTKRWQAAFELSKILANPKLLPKQENFYDELISTFEHATTDDNRVRQYLALAMGRTGKKEFVKPLINGLVDEKEENLAALIYALGMLKDKEALEAINPYVDHPNARIRSTAVVALGNIGDGESKNILIKALADPEPNVEWGAAISLAQLGDNSGKQTLLQLLNRDYLSKFSEVDMDEQTNLMLTTLEAITHLQDSDLTKRIEELSRTDQNMKIRSAALKILK